MTLVPVRINTPAGPVELELEADEGAVHVSAVSSAAHLLADALLQASESFVEQRGFPVQCRVGCSACCRHLVSVTPLEAFVLADAVAALDDDARDGIEARATAVREHLASIGLLERLRTTAGDEGRKLVQDYFREQLACPMLVDDRCSVYASRPTGCRQLMVVSPPAHCANPDQGQVQRVPVFIDVQRALLVLSHSLFPDEPLQLPLPVALDWVRDHPELRGVGAKGVALVQALLKALR